MLPTKHFSFFFLFFPFLQMKNKWLTWIALGGMGFLLTACTKHPMNEQTPEMTSGTDSQNLLSSTETTMHCPEAVQSYLDAASLTGEGEKTVEKGNEIVVDYIGRLADGTVFDTSVESVAKACNTYTPGRPYQEGLSFVAGAGNMIAGFDAGVIGMKVGQTKTVTIPAKDAYGEKDDKYLMTFPKEDIPDNFKIGDEIPVEMGRTAKVVAKTDTGITLDFNHPLAGKELIFDITIKAIK